MTRWNVATIFFFSVDGHRRDINLVPNDVNIVTGASGTGKSALIKTLDYCLGSSKCELPAYVRRRCVAVGVKWVAGEAEMIVGRIVPPVGRITSTKMYAIGGRNLAIPDKPDDFQGEANVDAAKSFLERAFGIGDPKQETDVLLKSRSRATVRQIPSYLFVTKEVIYSETVLLHGLDDRDKSDNIVETLPYFLRVENEATASNERRLRQLRKALEILEAKEQTRMLVRSQLRDRASSLLFEANQLGMANEPDSNASDTQLILQLTELTNSSHTEVVHPNESELGQLYATRSTIISNLNEIKRERKATELALSESEGFRGAIHRQHSKLNLVDFLDIDNVADKCPVCESTSEKGRVIVQSLKTTIEKIRGESVAVGRVQPKLVTHLNSLIQKADEVSAQLRQTDFKIRGILNTTKVSENISEIAQVRAHLLGRISFFLETIDDLKIIPAKDTSILKGEIENLELGLDSEAREIRLRFAESEISRFASEIFDVLPKVAPCDNAALSFFSRKPEITMIERGGTGAILRMPDIGSDQNYLAVHIALSFALQRYFHTVNSPVPGILVLDQVSRPYFPAQKDSDETLVKGEDEDVLAMRKHIDFLFSEISRSQGLQILLIEHAYFADDPRYVTATRERWTRPSKLALIPLDWPTRPDKQSS